MTTPEIQSTSRQPPKVIEPSEPIPISVPSGSFEYLSTTLHEPSDVVFSIEHTESDVIMAVYGRKGSKPTHARHNVHALLIFEKNYERSTNERNNSVVFKQLASGDWIFGVYNDNNEPFHGDVEFDQKESDLATSTVKITSVGETTRGTTDGQRTIK
ncbi:uncharacterized protein [Ptychodera flava]|uniref:uncharacterized protein n=1 Tax=Ptychodera flava TaxID=63121 RepID=UPI00396A1181